MTTTTSPRSASTSNSGNDVTRLLSASVYENYDLRTKLIEALDNPCRSIAEPFGVNSEVVMKHALYAKEKNSTFYYTLILPSLVFIISTVLYFLGIINVSFFIPFVSYIFIFIIVYIHKENNIKFLKENFSINSNNAIEYVSDLNFPIVTEYLSRVCDNIVYYSGYSPFVGSGYDNGGWSFVVDTTKSKQSFNLKHEVISFSQEEVYNFIDMGVKALNINNLKVEDKIFVNGKKIRSDKYLLQNMLSHPVTNVSNEYLNQLRNSNVRDSRYYKVLQTIEWGGDIIITAYFRVQQDEKSLFIENNYFILPPIDDKYKTIDSIKDQSGPKYILRRVREAALSALSNSIISITYVVGEVSIFFSRGKKRKEILKEVKESPDYDYGASTSIREFTAQGYYKQFFQKLDKERLVKIIDKTIFNLISEFLDSKNIDTSEFKEREASILNQGVIVTGGSVSGENISVGSNSKIVNRVKRTITNEK